ncbi:hypothetical protein AB0O07_23840 [Streptomyces sp. NPDC093085]|uniref:hypothetical protein n=1 Tax=Streptomyces sp. NPDC093085 TaxID=3155068 RepID=UPI003423928A
MPLPFAAFRAASRELGTAIGAANAATPLGGAVGTPVVVAVIQATNGNWRAPFIIFGVIGVLFGCIPLVGSAVEAVALMVVIIFLLYFTGAQYWTVVAEEVPGPRYGSVAGVVQFIAGCAGFLAPLVTGAVVEHARSWTTAFTIAAVIAATGALLLAVAGRGRAPVRRA